MTDFPTYEEVAELLTTPNFTYVPFNQADDALFVDFAKQDDMAWYKIMGWEPAEWLLENPRHGS